MFKSTWRRLFVQICSNPHGEDDEEDGEEDEVDDMFLIFIFSDLAIINGVWINCEIANQTTKADVRRIMEKCKIYANANQDKIKMDRLYAYIKNVF